MTNETLEQENERLRANVLDERSNRKDWQRKYFEMERAQSQAIDSIGELVAKVMRRERELAERSSDKNIAISRAQVAEANYAKLLEIHTWIKVKDRLPNEVNDYLVFWYSPIVNFGGYETSLFENGKFRGGNLVSASGASITHWMQLPPNPFTTTDIQSAESRIEENHV